MKTNINDIDKNNSEKNLKKDINSTKTSLIKNEKR